VDWRPGRSGSRGVRQLVSGEQRGLRQRRWRCDRASAVTVTLANGAYDSPSTPTGPVKVAFNITQPSGPEVTNDRGATYRESKSLVPAKYAGGMDLTVGDDNDAQDFNLEG
jgi:hypothetical protein